MTKPDKQKTEYAVDLSNLNFSWRSGEDPILKIARMQIKHGEWVFIVGPSGSGKSTLLSIIAGVVSPQEGTIVVNGCHLNTHGGAERDRFRADNIGFIYQMFNLIPYLSVLENVILPCRFSLIRREHALGRSSEIKLEAQRLLKHLGMSDKKVLDKPVTELSMGQQQRVAAARALIGAPKLVIADEPTSSLDAGRREAFIKLLFNESLRDKTTIVFVSHDTSLGGLFDRTISLDTINKV